MRGFEVKQKNVHTKVYTYNVKVVKKGLEGSFRLKHVIQTLFNILYGHLNLNQKKIEFNQLPVKPAGKPIKPAGKLIKPAGKLRNLNSTGTDRFPAKPDRYTGTGLHRFGRTGR